MILDLARLQHPGQGRRRVRSKKQNVRISLVLDKFAGSPDIEGTPLFHDTIVHHVKRRPTHTRMLVSIPASEALRARQTFLQQGCMIAEIGKPIIDNTHANTVTLGDAVHRDDDNLEKDNGEFVNLRGFSKIFLRSFC